MELSDIISRIESTLGAMENDDAFKLMFNKYLEADNDVDKTDYALWLWNYISDKQTVPNDLDSDGDSELASMLMSVAEFYGDTRPVEYALLVMHHRLILGDLLEKAFISHLFLRCMLELHQLMDEIIELFIEGANGDSFYGDYLDPDDFDLGVDKEGFSTFYCELMRSILPYLLWLKSYYPQYNLDDVLTPDYLQYMNDYNSSKTNSKPALLKLSALCRFIYEDVHK